MAQGGFRFGSGRKKDNAPGLQRHPLYSMYNGMRGRCHNPRHSAYKDYGAKGVTVCYMWLVNFYAFVGWAETHGYEKGLTIDRINTAGNYEPSNCQWIPRSKQNDNKRNSVRITAFGDTKTINEWAADHRSKANRRTMEARYYRGWSPEKIIGQEIHNVTKPICST